MANNSGAGINFLLGAEYERKKQKLHEELQMDFRRYLGKKKDPKVGVHNESQDHGLSLPIAERISEKEKLREERNREYNLFLQEHARTRNRGQFSVPSKPEEPSHVVHKQKEHSLPESYRASRKDAAMVTDTISKKGTKTRDLRHQRRRDFLSSQENSNNSEETFDSDGEEKLEFSHRRKPNGRKSKYIKDTKELRVKRVPVEMKYDEVFSDENNNDQNQILRVPHERDKGKVAERPMQNITAAPARVWGTGLAIGHSDEQDTLQKKKEQYKKALQNQIAEQHENKRKEKMLDLQVAATGATDPHSRLDLFRQIGPERHTYEKLKQKVSYKPESGGIMDKDNPELKHFSPGRPSGAFASPTRGENVPLKCDTNHDYCSPDLSVGEYNKSFSHMIGDVDAKRVSPIPPPLPPRVEHTYKTPHDETYNYYGSRHPLEQILSVNQNNIEGPQELEGSLLPQQRLQLRQQVDPGQRPTIIPGRDPSSQNNRHKRESYQEALEQQLKEKADRRRKEKEEQERFDAKKENEMMYYNPWGRAGAGAPVIDQSGNLISDLDQMHKLNENSNLKSGMTPQAQSAPLPGLEQLGYKKREHSQQDRYKVYLKQQIEESKRKQAEERERKKIQEEQDEKRLAEERARIQREYEQEKQRVRNNVQRKTNDELLAAKGKDHDKGKTMTDKPEKDRNNVESEKEASTSRGEREEESTGQTQTQKEPQLTQRGCDGPKDDYKEALKQQMEENKQRQAREREKQRILDEKAEKRFAQQSARLEEEQRNRMKMQNKLDSKPHTNENNDGDQEKKRIQPVTPLPTFQHKPSNTNVPSSPAAEPRLSPHTGHVEESESKKKQNQPEQLLTQKHQHQDHQEVITELGTLRKILRKKKHHLEMNLMQRDTVNDRSISRHQSQVRAVRGEESRRGLREEHVQLPTQTLHSTQNFKEFNQLKYRDTSSREELLHNHPDPPSDESSLDTQQQVLLREQQRRLELMKRSKRLCEFMREPVKSLPADKLFQDVYGCKKGFPRHPSPFQQPRRRHYDEEDKMNHLEADAPSWPSDKSVQSDRHESPPEHQGDEEVDLLSGRSSRSARERPVSVGTVAMEPWLQPSTS